MRVPPIPLLLTLTIIALAIGLRLADPAPVARLRLSVFDSYLALSPRKLDPAVPVRIVDVDEASLAKVGQWPWPRTRLAEIIDRLKEAGARTIAIDMILAEPDRLSPGEFAKQLEGAPGLEALAEAVSSLPSNDSQLASAISKAPVVLGFSGENRASGLPEKPRARFAFAGDDPRSFVPHYEGAISTLPALVARAPGLGAVNWIPVRDQIIRRAPLLVTVGDVLYPSLPMEALRLALGETTIFVRSSGGSGIPAFGQRTGVESIRVGRTTLPTDANGELWLRFTEPDSRRYISASRILDGTFDVDGVAGRDILIGTSAVGLLDLRATPLALSVPGVEIHAQALEQMLSGEHLVRPAYATGAELVFLVIAGLFVAWLIQHVGAVAAAIVGAFAIAAVTAASWGAYTGPGFLFDPVYPAIAILLVYLATSLHSYIRSEVERHQVRTAFSRYVAPPLVEELAKNHARLKLGGEMRDVSVLFADVRGFTKISEGMNAEDLVSFLNALFTPLSEIILNERGTIDKFMGDAVMAFWNAPLADEAHARDAARAALKMIEAVEQINERQAVNAKMDGEAPTPVRIGIGLNTGRCCVGNMGSPQRFDYSIIGDPVNIAARLEEATKTYGVPIIAGERTAEAAKDLAFLEIGSVAVRGKVQPERIFVLVGDDKVAVSERFRALSRAHDQFMQTMSAGEKSGSLAQLQLCRRQDWRQLAPLYDRLEALLQETS